MALRARKPSVPTKRRCKVVVYGGPGVGKTWFTLDFPGVYYIDTEGGSKEAHYKQRMLERGIEEVTPEQGAADFDTVVDEFKTLASTKHPYRTAVLDSFTHLYLLKAAEAEEKVGSDYGRDKKEANRPTRQLLRWVRRADMNVIFVCHQKEKWEKKEGSDERTVVGKTFDGYDKLEYDLDLIIEATPTGPKKAPLGVVRKSRLLEFPLGDRFQLTYDEFAKRFGREHLEGAAAPVELPSADEVKKLRQLVRAAQVSEDVQTKWMHKAEAESFEEMPRESVLKCIAFCESKLSKESEQEEVPVAV